MARLRRSRIVLLSGPMCAGKSELAQRLEARHGAKIIRTRDLISAARPETPNTRSALQKAGQALDKADGGAWVKTALARVIEGTVVDGVQPDLFVIDAVRIRGQIEAVRDAFGPEVHHVHVTA